MCIACVCCILCVMFVLIVAFFLWKPICDEVHFLTHAFTRREKGIQFIETQTARNNSSNLYKRRRSRGWNLFNKYALMKAAFHYLFLLLFFVYVCFWNILIYTLTAFHCLKFVVRTHIRSLEITVATHFSTLRIASLQNTNINDDRLILIR